MSDIDTRPRFTDPTGRPSKPDRAAHEKDRRKAEAHAQELRDDERFLADIDARADADERRMLRDRDWHVLERLEVNIADARERELDYTSRARLAAGSGMEDEARKADTIARTAFERRRTDEARAAEVRSRISVREAAPYGPDSPYSWFADMATAASPKARDKTDAQERLRRHAKDVGTAAVGGTRRARRALRDASRKDESLRMVSEREYRAMSSGATSGGSLVTPDYLLGEWVKYRSYVPAIADACGSADLPDYGLEVKVPAVTSGAAVEVQVTENTPVTSTTFTTTYRTAAVATYAGSTKISQQLFDRSGPGLSFDAVVYAQLRETLDQQVSAAVAQAMIAAATTTVTRTGATVATVPDVWADVAKAALSLEDTAGTLLFATHTFLTPQWYRYGASSVDKNTRPIWTPDLGCKPNPATGYTGYSIAGSDVFTDGAIPQNGAHSGNAQLIVANPAKGVLLLRGEPIAQVIPEPYAEDLSVLVRLYQYVAVVVRHASAAAVITSTDGAYTTTPSA